MTNGNTSLLLIDRDRRALLRRAVAVAAAGSAGSLLSACGHGGTDHQEIGAQADTAGRREQWTPGSAGHPSAPGGAIEPPGEIGVGGAPGTVKGLPQFRTWDGLTGTHRQYWNRGAKLRWRNPNVGDWLDAGGVSQGETPFASAKWTESSSQSLDVTSLVARQLKNGNRGVLLQATGTDFSIGFGGSKSPQAPTLTIVTTDGTFNARCLATSYWALGSSNSYNGQILFKVQRKMHHAIVQFDYTGVTGAVKSATMILTSTDWKRVTTVQAFEADPPAYNCVTVPTLGGIARSFVHDAGIESHPSVLFASDFTDMSKWDVRRKMGNAALITDDDGLPALRCRTPAGEQSGIGLTQFLMRGISPGGPPDRVVDEAYFRYYLTLENDWRSEVDANKTPGFDCRMGIWQAGGYWENLGGNGGAANDGRHVMFQSGKRGYKGHMIRGHSGQQVTDGNPYSELVWLGTYNYNIDQAGDYGDSIRWGNFVIARGQKVCIEHRIKMNSLTGPEDEFGNREAAHDGIYQVWVNGELAMSLAGMRWRRHPQLGVAAIDLSMYHGGKSPAPRDMHCRWGNVVLATKYIGPVVK